MFLIITDESRPDLPPPPTPPATDDSPQLFVDTLSRRPTDRGTREGNDLPTIPKKGEDFSPPREGLDKWLSQGKKGNTQ